MFEANITAIFRNISGPSTVHLMITNSCQQPNADAVSRASAHSN
jgi:hypothetical protein